MPYTPTTEKTCVRCGELQPLDGFTKYTKRGVTRHRATCRKCLRPGALARETRYRNSEKGKLKLAAKKRRSMYGISDEMYSEILTRQKGCCAICHGAPRSQALGVDHDHKTGKVRGLLCSPCNVALGMLKDDPELLLRAAIYLEENV